MDKLESLIGDALLEKSQQQVAAEQQHPAVHDFFDQESKPTLTEAESTNKRLTTRKKSSIASQLDEIKRHVVLGVKKKSKQEKQQHALTHRELAHQAAASRQDSQEREAEVKGRKTTPLRNRKLNKAIISGDLVISDRGKVGPKKISISKHYFTKEKAETLDLPKSGAASKRTIKKKSTVGSSLQLDENFNIAKPAMTAQQKRERMKQYAQEIKPAIRRSLHLQKDLSKHSTLKEIVNINTAKERSRSRSSANRSKLSISHIHEKSQSLLQDDDDLQRIPERESQTKQI